VAPGRPTGLPIRWAPFLQAVPEVAVVCGSEMGHEGAGEHLAPHESNERWRDAPNEGKEITANDRRPGARPAGQRAYNSGRRHLSVGHSCGNGSSSQTSSGARRQCVGRETRFSGKMAEAGAGRVWARGAVGCGNEAVHGAAQAVAGAPSKLDSPRRWLCIGGQHSQLNACPRPCAAGVGVSVKLVWFVDGWLCVSSEGLQQR
jgi:hypothetical protein